MFKIYHTALSSIIRRHILSTEFMWSPDGKFGAKEKDGSFNGIIGVLQRGEADIAINAVSLTSDRAKAADASLPLGNYE